MTSCRQRPLLYTTSALVALATALCFAPTTADAQVLTASGAEPSDPDPVTQLDDIVVQARRTDERQQTVPIAITAVDGERLENAAANAVSDIQRLVPSLQIGQDTSGQQTFVIRGSPGGVGSDPAVINYLDEVPVESRSLIYSLFDLRSVQVLKGSQGTLFGRNSTGGAVLFFSRRPDPAAFGGYATLRLGNLDERRLEGAINLPVNDTLAFRLAGQLHRRDGLLESVSVPGLEYGDRHNEAVRASILWRPHTAVENYTQITHYRQEETAPAPVLIGLAGPCTGPATPAPVCLYQPPFTGLLRTGDVRAFFDQQQALPEGLTVNDGPSIDDATRDSITNALTIDFGQVSFKNIFYYGQSDLRFTKDYDGTPVRIFDLDQTDSIETVYTETQLYGSLWGDRLDWRVGGVFSEDRIDQTVITSVFALPVSATQPRRGIADETFQSRALFAQGTYNLSDWLNGVSLTAGYRHTWDDRDLVQQVFQGQPTSVCALQTLPGPVPFPNTDLATCTRRLSLQADDYNYNLTLDWQPTDQVLLYLSSRRGYKSGSFNLLANDPTLVTYAPEVVDDLEFGLKADWTLGSMPVRTNLSVFRSQYTNIQVSTVRINPANGDISVLILNQNPVSGAANEATIEGFELEVLAAPTDWLEVSAFYSKFDSVYDQFVVPGTTNDLAGQNVAGVIPETWGATVQASLPAWGPVAGIDATLSYYFRGQPQRNATTTLFEDSRTAFDARVTLRDLFGSGADLSAFGKNLGDEIACPVNTSVSGARNEICGDGRTYGLELTYRFGGEAR